MTSLLHSVILAVVGAAAFAGGYIEGALIAWREGRK